jgi:hypothetical protein
MLCRRHDSHDAVLFNLFGIRPVPIILSETREASQSPLVPLPALHRMRLGHQTPEVQDEFFSSLI